MSVVEELVTSIKLTHKTAHPKMSDADAVIVGEGVTDTVVEAEAEHPPLSPETE